MDDDHESKIDRAFGGEFGHDRLDDIDGDEDLESENDCTPDLSRV